MPPELSSSYYVDILWSEASGFDSWYDKSVEKIISPLNQLSLTFHLEQFIFLPLQTIPLLALAWLERRSWTRKWKKKETTLIISKRLPYFICVLTLILKRVVFNKSVMISERVPMCLLSHDMLTHSYMSIYNKINLVACVFSVSTVFPALKEHRKALQLKGRAIASEEYHF